MVRRLFYYMTLVAAVLLTACSDNDATIADEPLPEGMGRLRITLCTPEENPNLTRAVNVNPWENPDHEWERLQTFRVFICKSSNNQIVQIIEGDKTQMSLVSGTTSTYKQSVNLLSDPLPAGTYKIYATANFADGYSVGDVINLDRTEKFANGYSEANIPMTGQLDGTVTVVNAKETDAGIISVWRVMAKLQFEFTNMSSSKIRIKGIEVEPINQASSTKPGIYLFSKDNLESTANLVPLFPAGATKKGVSALWPLNTSTLQTTASVSMGGAFATTGLTVGSKLNASGLRTAGTVSLQKFIATADIGSTKDNDAVITFTVTPKTGMTFTPKNVTFKATRGGTNGGNFDVEVTSSGTTTTLATGERPARSNGDNGNGVAPFTTEYSYPISSAATTDAVVVKIYVYNLASGKDYAFSDVAISGDVTNNTGAALQELVTLPAGARTDVGSVVYEPTEPLELNATNGEGTLFFYVNETDTTYTTTENQLSVRFKIQRWNGSAWTDEEIRYGVTTHYSDGTTGHNGFNVIRRNDWIHIPVALRDWTFRVEPRAFVPIAGYPATTLSSDGLTTTFSTGGYIILQPFAQKNSDGTWRDFSDPEVTFVSMSWTNNDGTNVSGSGKILESPLVYDPVTKCITGVLNNSLTGGKYMTTVTVNTKLGPTGSQFDYSFTFNVVLQK